MEGTDDFSTTCHALLALKKATPFVEGPVAPMRIGALFLHGCHVCHLSQAESVAANDKSFQKIGDVW
ncbi:hypothetical protein Peur_049994 [Populus x canadensis]